MISSLCRSQTLPIDFEEVLSKYTKEGFRVIALSYKEMPGLSYRKAQTISREDTESDLIFLGLLIMENKLKDVTNKIIKNLHDCDVRTVMATGDNVLTAISVARQCGILDAKQEVFLGEIAKDQQGLEYVKWTSSLPVNVNYGTTNASMSDIDNDDREVLMQANTQSSDYLPWNF